MTEHHKSQNHDLFDQLHRCLVSGKGRTEALVLGVGPGEGRNLPWDCDPSRSFNNVPMNHCESLSIPENILDYITYSIYIYKWLLMHSRDFTCIYIYTYYDMLNNNALLIPSCSFSLIFFTFKSTGHSYHSNRVSLALAVGIMGKPYWSWKTDRIMKLEPNAQ